MKSPRPSYESAGFADPGQASTALLEDYELGSNSSSPPPYTPTTTKPPRDYIFVAQIAGLIVNIIPIFFPLLDAPHSLFPLFPLTFFTSWLTIIPMGIAMSNVSAKKKKQSTKKTTSEEVGTRRVAVLVEDPVTGEERWMLEPEKEEEEAAPAAKSVVAAMYACCVVALLLSAIVSIIFGRDSPRILAAVVVFRGVGIVLGLVVIYANWERKSLADLEEEA